MLPSRPPAPCYARLSARVLAFAVDSALLSVLVFLSAAALRAVFGPTLRFGSGEGGGLRPIADPDRLLAVAVLSAALSGAYFIWSWTRRQATPGQAWSRIRVVRAADQGRPSLRQTSIRWLFLIGPLALGAVLATRLPAWRATLDLAALGWFLALLASVRLSPRRQGLHDRAAGTIVTGPGRPRPAHPPRTPAAL